MPRLKVGFGVVALGLLALAGCASTDVFSLGFWQTAAADGDQVVLADLETVSRSAQGALSQLGLTAVVNKKGETVSLTSTNKAGKRFTIVLTRETSATSERTRVHVDWENGKDESFAFELLSKIVVQHAR